MASTIFGGRCVVPTMTVQALKHRWCRRSQHGGGCGGAGIHTTASRPCSSTDMEGMLKEVRRFVIEDIIPTAAQYDKSGEYPWPIVRKAHALGLMNADLPEELGGLHLRLAEKVRIYEEIGYGDTAVGTSMMVSELAQAPLLRAGSEHLRRKYLGRMLEQPILASYAVTECNAGSDLASLKMTAVRHEKASGDPHHYVLNGAKAWITNAGIADWYFVLARTAVSPSESSSSRAFTGFVVERGTRGLTIGEKESVMGQRCSDTRSIHLEDVEVPAENVVGEVGGGFQLALKAFARTRPIIAAIACGLARRALDEAGSYATQRRTFGKAIGEHQGVGFKLADMAMRLEAARQLTYLAARKVDEGSSDADQYSSMAKCFSSEQAFDAAVSALQIHGANGLCTEYPVEKLVRDARVLQIYGGTSEIQRLVISRNLLAKYSSMSKL